MMRSESTANFRRLHPIAIFFFIFKSVKDLLYPLIVFLLSSVFTGKADTFWLIPGSIVFVLLVILIGWSSWMRYQYDVRDRVLYVKQGIFIHKNLSIPSDRIQSLDQSAGLLHRLFGVLMLQVETAGGKKPEAALSAISTREADRIRTALFASSPALKDAHSGTTMIHNAQHALKEPVHTETGAALVLTSRRLLLYSATSGRATVALAVIAAAYSQLEDVLERFFDFQGTIHSLLGSGGFVWWIAMLLIAAYLIGVAVTMTKEYKFTLRKSEGKLILDRGLLESKQASFAVKRIQALQVKQNVLLRLFGYINVYLVSAGSTGKDRQSVLLFPILRISELPSFLEIYLSAAYIPNVQMEGMPKKAISNYWAFPVFISAIAAIAGIMWVPGGFGWFALLLPILALVWSWLRYKAAAWNITGDQLTIRSGAASLTTTLVSRRRIQWCGIRTSPLQSLKQLSTLSLALASGKMFIRVHLQHAPLDTCESLVQWVIGKTDRTP